MMTNPPRPDGCNLEVAVRGRALRVFSASLLFGLMLGTSCAGESSSDGSPGGDAAAEIVRAYRAYRTAFDQAADPPRPDHPALRRTAAGKELERLREVLDNDREVGLVRRGETELHPRVTEIEGDRAVIRDCYLERGAVYLAATGEVVFDPGDEHVNARITLRKIDDTWKVVEEVTEDRPCNPDMR